MPSQLTEQDRDFLWQVALREAERIGGHERLFMTPLEFDEDNGRVHFHWPEWMQEIRAYFSAKYPAKETQYRMLDAVSELMSRERYDARRFAARRSAGLETRPQPLWR